MMLADDRRTPRTSAHLDATVMPFCVVRLTLGAGVPCRRSVPASDRMCVMPAGKWISSMLCGR